MAVLHPRPAGIFLAEPVPIHPAPSKLFDVSVKLKASPKDSPTTALDPKPSEDLECRPATKSSPRSNQMSLMPKGNSPPECKCESVGLVCEGYALPKAPKQAVPPSRQLLPRIAQAGLASKAAALLRSATDIAPKLPMQPGLGFDASGDDGWYMALFRERVASDLSPGKGANFWIRSSFRDSMTMKAIRHSILGIGAYSRALIDLKTDYPWIKTADRPWWPSSIQNRHHQAALDHHIKAISYLQQDIRNNNVDDRMAMAANLLLIVFENMRGNYHVAGNLVRSGIKVLNRMGQRGSHVFRRDGLHILAAFHRDGQCPVPHGKSAYHLLLNDDSPTSDDEENFPVSCLIEDTTPHSCMEARAIWDRILHSLAGFYAKALWINLHQDFSVDKDGLAWEQALYLSRLQEFGLGLSTIVAVERNANTARPLTFLTIHHLVATIFTSCCLDPSEAAYDSFASEFDTLLSHIQAYLEIPSTFTIGFTNEVGILPLLAFVAAKCRLLHVRLAAIDLLMNYGWREGPWDGVSLARAMEGLMNIEGQNPPQAGQDAGQGDGSFAFAQLPSADTRYAWTNMFWDYETQEMTMEYTKLLPNIDGGLDKKTLTVSWK
ncbi:hypothetical protein PG997_014481 [Apiospora hydei]|uniref:Zn(2)-C6 fungal-type domain-containing protein n=1 Tax=Apiospora hydei TaxID=1337664 RepID=A0ABR1UTY1_9PEZI